MSQQNGQDVSLEGLRVMVIDDSKTIRRTAETLLAREGCEVVTATDGFEALSKIAELRKKASELVDKVKFDLGPGS